MQPLYIDTTPAAKPVINLADLAEVDALAPPAIRRRAPLDVLTTILYSLAFRKPRLIEEAEFRLHQERKRRAAPMQLSYSATRAASASL